MLNLALASAAAFLNPAPAAPVALPVSTNFYSQDAAEFQRRDERRAYREGRRAVAAKRATTATGAAMTAVTIAVATMAPRVCWSVPASARWPATRLPDAATRRSAP